MKARIPNKLIQALGCVGNVKGFTDYNAVRLQDCYGTLPL